MLAGTPVKNDRILLEQNYCQHALAGGDFTEQEAQLLQRDRVMHYVSKFVLCFTSYESVRFQAAKVTFKVIQGHWQWCHLIGHIDFLLVFHCNYASVLHFYRYIITYFPKFKKVT